MSSAEAISASAGFNVQPQMFFSSPTRFNPGGTTVRTVAGSGTVFINDDGSLLSPLLGGYLSWSGASPSTVATGTGNATFSALNIGANVAFGAPNVLFLDAGFVLPSGEALNVFASRSATTDNGGSGNCVAESVLLVNPASNSSAASTSTIHSLLVSPTSNVTLSSFLNGSRTEVALLNPCTLSNGASSLRGFVRLVRGSLNNYAALLGGLFVGCVVGTGCSLVTCTAGTIAGMRCFSFQFPSTGTGSLAVTLAIGLQIQGPTANTSALNVTFVQSLGVDVANVGVTSAATSVGIRLANQQGASSANYGIWFTSNTAGTGSGIVFGAAADASFWRGAASQLLTQGDWLSRHYLCSSTPTVAAGAAAGTAPTTSITGSDHGFAVTLTTGNPSATTGTLFTVTFGAAFTTNAPQASFSAGNANAAALTTTSSPYISALATTTLTFTSGSVALPAATQYIWRFTVMR